MKILVTGAAGFIGSHASRILLDRGDEVVGLDNLNDYYDVQLKLARLERLKAKPGFRFVKLDLADREGMQQLFATEKFDRVIHLAAQAGVRYSIQNPLAYVDSNVVGTANVLEGCRTTASGTSSMRRRVRSTAPTRRCRSPSTRTWIIRCRSTRRPRRPTS